jgi:hypothetical protein
MKDRINEYDMTKKMTEMIRNGYKKVLFEDDSMRKEKDTITPVVGDAVFNDELQKLRDTVSPRIKITKFKIYPVDENVIIEGVMEYKENEGSGIIFKMSLAAGEIETTMNDVELNDNVSTLLKKLKGYYENFRIEWGKKLPTEYRPKTE